MIRIRSNIFETNSSAAHAIIIANNPIEDKYHKNLFEDIRIEERYNAVEFNSKDLYFGYDFKVLYRPMDKLGYVLAVYDGRNKKELEDLLSKHTDGKINKIMIYPQDYGIEDRHNKYGCIDQDARGTFEAFRRKNRKKITLEEFIFNPKYMIILDYQGDGEFVSLLEKGLINTDFKVFGDNTISTMILSK